jgi:hypothetical protein
VRSSLEERIDRAAVVAVVRVETLSRHPGWLDDSLRTHGRVEPIVVGHELIEAFKGADLLPDRLVTGFGGGDCGLPLQPAEDVLVIGTPEADGPHAGELRLSVCAGSRVLGVHSLLGARDQDEAGRRRWQAVLDAMRQNVLTGEPVHACVGHILQLVPPPPGPNDDALDCGDFLDGYGLPEAPPEISGEL